MRRQNSVPHKTGHAVCFLSKERQASRLIPNGGPHHLRMLLSQGDPQDGGGIGHQAKGEVLVQHQNAFFIL